MTNVPVPQKDLDRRTSARWSRIEKTSKSNREKLAWQDRCTGQDLQRCLSNFKAQKESQIRALSSQRQKMENKFRRISLALTQVLPSSSFLAPSNSPSVNCKRSRSFSSKSPEPELSERIKNKSTGSLDKIGTEEITLFPKLDLQLPKERSSTFDPPREKSSSKTVELPFVTGFNHKPNTSSNDKPDLGNSTSTNLKRRPRSISVNPLLSPASRFKYTHRSFMTGHAHSMNRKKRHSLEIDVEDIDDRDNQNQLKTSETLEKQFEKLRNCRYLRQELSPNSEPPVPPPAPPPSAESTW